MRFNPARLAALVLAPIVTLQAAGGAVSLPTPKEHYRIYDADKAALELMGKVMNDLDPETQGLVTGFLAGGASAENVAKVDAAKARRIVDALGLRKYKGELIEVVLHQSQVLEVIPEEHRNSILPIVHDALLAFMDGLSEDRLAERVAAILGAPAGMSRGEKVLLLASRIVTLQKVGQIIARFDAIPPDIRERLQTLENEISTMTRDELVAYIVAEVGQEAIDRYQIRFEDKVLAEASVGAVIRGSYLPPGGTARDEIVCKVVKPYAFTGLPEEMRIIDRLIGLVEKHADFYAVRGVNLRDFFRDIRSKLEDEIRVVQEQANFKRAYAYYQGRPGVSVPRIFDISTGRVTFMEYLHIEKMTDSFAGDRKRRAALARHLLDVMSYEPLFSKPETSIFHGDPHAGNVTHVTGDPRSPYTLGLLDWGLLGEFPRAQRVELVQLSLALMQKRRGKVKKNAGALIRGGLPDDPARRAEIGRMVDEALAAEGKGVFETYAAVLERLFAAGYAPDPNMSLFIKSQVTLAGIFRELDPDLNQDRYLRGRVMRQVLKETPKRLLLLPAWNYRGYRSLLTNGDVFGEVFR